MDKLNIDKIREKPSKIISTEESLKDVEPCLELKEFININKEKIYHIAETNTKRNERGQVVITREEAEE